MIRIEVSGIETNRVRLGEVIPKTHEAVRELAERIFEFAFQKADAHTKSGELIRSLGTGPVPIKDGWEIGHDLQIAPHALFVHWGTQSHVIRPKERKALRWVGKDGKFVFSKRVQHPGYKGDPWLIHAAEEALRDFDGIVREKLNGL